LLLNFLIIKGILNRVKQKVKVRTNRLIKQLVAQDYGKMGKCTKEN
jgi:hypothetical protein